ncbi:cobyrinate a,c-diamide synthase [Megasphaera sp.]|uniref:cobyrinate a,c-diamide synthase n=1 Tax=Megasphaera sp. TaxID=2023260 RepID=UPI00351FAFB0
MSVFQTTPLPPRVLFAAPSSGSGKTTLVCALLQALKERGLSLAAFKSGPDYIDPMFHRRVLETPSYNLDLFLLGRGEKGAARARQLLAKHGEGVDLAVLEGAMGYYDGVGTSHEASAYDLAAATATPVIVVVDGRGAGLSLAAVLKGMASFYPDSHVAGFIVNRVKPMVYAHFKKAWEEGSGLKALGCFPEMPDCTFSRRHLGLVTAGEIADLREIMQKLADQAEKSLDMEAILECGGTIVHRRPFVVRRREGHLMVPQSSIKRCAASLSHNDERRTMNDERFTHIAVARDEAFCFYYEDSLDVLRQCGAELVFFSPLHDKVLPPCDGLYLGGGYPELYAGALSDNVSMRQSIARALVQNLPCFAECGGFMYLHEYFRTADGRRLPWVGAVHGETFMTKSLRRFGYVTLTAGTDSLFGPAGIQIEAHEFHYSDSTDSGSTFTAQKAGSARTWPCMVVQGNLVAGYPHLHFAGNPEWAAHFVQAARRHAAPGVSR